MNTKDKIDTPTYKQLGQGVGFERIRRITGYLTGSIEQWNKSKKSELNDRIKHN